MTNPFDKFDPQDQAGGNAFDKFDGDAEPKARGITGMARDMAAWGLKGAIGLVEAPVGVADIVTGGRVGKALENEGGAFGFRPKQAREAANDWHSEATKDAQRKFQEADGIGGKLQAAIQNPSNIVGAVAESLPSMAGGAVAARGLLGATRLGQAGAKATAAAEAAGLSAQASRAAGAAASQRAATIAGAAGEGTMMAGSQAEAIRQETPDGLLTPGQAGIAALTGGIGGLIGGASGRFANKLGVGDADTMLAQGAKGLSKQNADEAAAAAANPLVQQAAKSVPRQVIEGAITEGLLEELPQSVAEQLLQNLALDKPWSEGLDDAIVLGVLSGGAMGAGAAGFRGITRPGEAAPGAAPSAGPAPAPIPPGAGPDWTTEAGAAGPGAPAAAPIQPTDGNGIPYENTRIVPEWDTQPGVATAPLAGSIDMPEQAREFDTGDLELQQPAPVKPSEAMGLNPNAGALSAAAVQAVDSGASDALQAAAAQAQTAEQAARAPVPTKAQAEEIDLADIADPYERAYYESFFADAEDAQIGPEVKTWLQDDTNIPDLDAASNASDEDFLRALGANDQEITDAIASIASQPSRPQEDAQSLAGAQANEPADTRQGAGEAARTQGGQVDAGARGEADADISGVDRPGLDDAGRGAADTGAGMPETGGQPGAIARAPDAGNAQAAAVGGSGAVNDALSNGAAPKNLKEGLAAIRAKRAEEQAAQAGVNPQAEPGISQAEPGISQAEPGISQVEPGISHQVEPGISQVEPGISQIEPGPQVVDGAASPYYAPVGDIRAVVAKQIPDMTDAEIGAAIDHYGPDHARTGKLQKEQARRAAPAPKPAPVNPSVKARIEAARQARADHFAPGNIVKSYSGHDRVVSYNPPPKEGGNWSVTVQAVVKQGDAWVDAPNESQRTHSTQPGERELKVGPVEKAQAKAADAKAPAILVQAAKDNGKLEIVTVGDKKPAPAPAPSPQATKERAALVAPKEELKGQEADSFRKLQELDAAGLHFDPLGKKDAAPGKVSGIPAYSGNKKSFVQKAGGRLAHWLKNAKGEVLYDAFGGGGGYGLWVVNNAAPNVRSLVINEIDAFRSIKLQWTLEHNGKLEQLFKSPTLAPVIDLMRRLDGGGSVVKAAPENARAGEMLNSPNAEKATTNLALYREIARLSEALTTEDKIALQAVIDRAYASRSSKEGIDTIISKAVADSVEYHAQAQAFSARGGKIFFTVHDGTDASKVPQGSIVLSDPPYLYTTGYKDSGEQSLSYIEGPEFFEKTKQMLQKSVDMGNTVIYHNSLAALAGMRTGEQFGARRATATSAGVAQMLDDFLPFKRSARAKVEDDFVGVKHGRFDEGTGGGRSSDAWVAAVRARPARVGRDAAEPAAEPGTAGQARRGAGPADQVKGQPSTRAAEVKEGGADPSGSAFLRSAGGGKASRRNQDLSRQIMAGAKSDAILADIAENSPDKALAFVARAIAAKGLVFEVRAVRNSAPGFVARYNTDNHRVEVDVGMPHDMERVLVHEAVHAVTAKYLREFGLKTGLGAKVASLLETAQAHARTTGASFYGLTDADEFLAEVMTNPEFARWLDTVPVRRMTALGQLVQAVAEFLGVRKSGAAAQAMRAFERIMVEQTALQAQYATKRSKSKDPAEVARAYGVSFERSDDGLESYFGSAEVAVNEEEGFFIVSGGEFTDDYQAARTWALNNGWAEEDVDASPPPARDPVEQAVADAYDEFGDWMRAMDATSARLRQAKTPVAWSAIRDAAERLRGSSRGYERAAPKDATPSARSNERLASAQATVEALQARWKDAPEIVVARNMQDSQIPQRVRDYDAQLKSQGADGEPRAFLFKKKVYLLADQLATPREVSEALLHEVVGHYGLRGAFGEALTPILKQVGALRRKDVLAKAREYGLAPAGVSDDAAAWAAMTESQRLEAAEEVLAEMAQATPEIGFVKRAIAAIRNWLRANVPGFKSLAMTDNDIIEAFILPARRFVERGSRGPGGGVRIEPTMGEAFARASSQTVQGGRIRRTLDELVAATESQANWRTWYDRHDAALERLFGDDAPLFQKILSATSQAATVKSNVGLALKAYDQLLSELPFTGYLPAVIKNLDRIRSEQELRGAKISQYGEANEGNTEAIAVDRHIAMLFFNSKTPNRAQIESAKTRIRKIAEQLQWEPRQVQAALWAFNQTRLGTNPEQVQSYDTILENKAELISALRARHQRAEGRSVPTGGAAGTRNSEGRAGTEAAGEVTFSRATDQTQTEAFKKWFAGSKVVDAEGKPLRVFHGTKADIQQFQLQDGTPDHGQGFFFTSSSSVASNYAGTNADGANTQAVESAMAKLDEQGMKGLYQAMKNRRVTMDWYGYDEAESLDENRLLMQENVSGLGPDEDGDHTALLTAAQFLGLPAYRTSPNAAVMPVFLAMKNPLEINAGGAEFHDETQADWIRQAKKEGKDGVIVRSYVDGGGFSGGDFRGWGRHDVYIAFRPEQIKSATGNLGTYDPENPDIRFSRAKMADLKTSAIDQIHQTLSHPGKVSLWDKTVGTMRNLAERNPAFKPVFDAAQSHIDDVSTMANDAADAAPRILPKLETWRDLGKKPVPTVDNAALGKALFGGTLEWARGADGKPVRVTDLQAQHAGKTAEQKVSLMQAAGHMDAGLLRMWRGLPIDQFEKLINSRFESKMLKAGVVWSDKELKTLMGMNDQQVSLYREARAAVDRSIDMTSRADMLRLLGQPYAAMRGAVLDAPTLQDAMDLLTSTLVADAKADPDASERLMQQHNQVVDRATQARDLMEAGYMPLSRFGQYTLDVVDAAGERQYFSLFESVREANQMALKMRSAFPGANVVQGTMSQQAFQLFQGVTPESLEMFGNMLGLDSEGNEAKDKAFQEYLKLTKNNHSALKRMIHRQGIAGYSEDVGRVLAGFVYSNARQAAGALNAGTMEQALMDIPKEQGELKDVALGLRSYISDPQEEGQAVRGMLFAQYLGGSVASAFVNMTQPFAVTLPWLSQFGGITKAGKYMASALNDMRKRGFKYEPDLAKALQAAEDDGTVSPQEVHQLMAQSRGAGALRSGDGTRTGDARAAVANNWERLKVGWGQPFALAEQFNRRSTFIAAYRMAKANGEADPAAFASKAVLETQFLYSKANKMRWGRGAVGGTLMTFKTYSISYLELMHRTWNAGAPGSPERAAGRRAVGWGMAMLMLMGGAGGLPFMEDLEDLIDALAQLMGYNVSAKQWRQQAMEDVVGKELADFLGRGISGLPGSPVDVSGRLGMGDLLPGTGLFQTKQSHVRDMLELAGPAGDLVGRAFSGGARVLKGDLAGAALEFSPSAVRNAAKGYDMWSTGIYKDTKGYKVLDTTLAEAASKFVGFQPKSVADVQEAASFTQRSKSFYTQTSSEIRAQWAKAIFDKDDAAVQRARERLADWNENNPDQRITIRMPDVWKRVREMGKDRDQRIADTAPKALRAKIREDLAQARG